MKLGIGKRTNRPTGQAVNRRTKLGFTLVEVLIALFIVLVGFAGLFQMFSFGYFRLKTVKNRLSAIHLCQEKMELILSFSYADIQTLYSSGTTEDVIIDYGANTASDTDDLKGTREVFPLEEWKVKKVGEVGVDTVGWKVTVKVFWPDRYNKERSETIISAVSDPNPD